MASLNILDHKVTHEGAPAFHLTPFAQLERSIMSCLLWESEFYEDGQTIARRIINLVKLVPSAEVLELILRAKNEMRLRHVPLLLARELMRTRDGRKLASKTFANVITRPDDITEFLTIYWNNNANEPLAKQIKIHLGNTFLKFNEYHLAKYNNNKKEIKLRDAMRILRPIPPTPEISNLWHKLVKGELTTPDTWEVELSQSKDKKASWTRLLIEDKLGGLALLRNLRNMIQVDVDVLLIRSKIQAIQAGRLLPINFIAAAKHAKQFKPDLEAKFFDCFVHCPKISGETIILIDVSGSMDCWLSQKSNLERIDVACSLGIIGREMFTDLRIFTFSNNLVEIPACHGFALHETIVNSQEHCCTILGDAIRKLPPCQRLIVITDEQSHDPVPQVKGYMINLASARNGVGYGTWTHINGWSDNVLDYIVKHEAFLLSKTVQQS